jgi:hypothetical protein
MMDNRSTPNMPVWRIAATILLLAVFGLVGWFWATLPKVPTGGGFPVSTVHTVKMIDVELSPTEIDQIKEKIAPDRLRSLSPFWEASPYLLAEVQAGVKGIEVSSKKIEFTFEWTAPPPPPLSDRVKWRIFFGNMAMPQPSRPNGEKVYVSEVALVLALHLLERSPEPSASSFQEAMRLLASLDVYDGVLCSRLTRRVDGLQASLSQDLLKQVPDWLMKTIKGQQAAPADADKPRR